ncbi:MAG TPA: IS1182 family transposase [Acidobacteriaceae bacterium]|nr:IS1182 family transposase [Acidobacteriaceae bacterium]
MRLAALDVEALIEANHPARLIWKLSEEFDLSQFEARQKSREGEAGRPCWSAQLLISIWVYSYSMGVASARAIERMMEYEPGLRWLSADQVINHHTLSDFRVGHQTALENLFAELLGMLDAAEVIDMTTLLHDGTKVRAVAGKYSLHRRKKLEERVKQARQLVKKLDAAAAENEEMDKKRQAAQSRVAHEALSRAQSALKKLKKKQAQTRASERDQVRVSESEPDAVKMKHPDGSWAPSYNVQVSTEAKSRMIVAIGLTTDPNDQHQLMPALERVKKDCGVLPRQIIADNGYVSRPNIEETTKAGVELIAPWKVDTSREAGACKVNGIASEFAPSQFRMEKSSQCLICPEGKKLVAIGEKVHYSVRRKIYQAKAADCAGCERRAECCGSRSGPRRVHRVMESEAMQQYLDRMQRPEVAQLYKRRCEIAEFPHLWTKGVKKLSRFKVRGLMKAAMEATWIAIAYNVTQWMRLGLAAA